MSGSGPAQGFKNLNALSWNGPKCLGSIWFCISGSGWAWAFEKLKNRHFGLKIIFHTALKSFISDFEILRFGPCRACLKIRFGLFRRLAYVVQA